MSLKSQLVFAYEAIVWRQRGLQALCLCYESIYLFVCLSVYHLFCYVFTSWEASDLLWPQENSRDTSLKLDIWEGPPRNGFPAQQIQRFHLKWFPNIFIMNFADILLGSQEVISHRTETTTCAPICSLILLRSWNFRRMQGYASTGRGSKQL